MYYGPPIVVDGRRFSPSTTFSDLGDETTLVELTPTGIDKRITVQGELARCSVCGERTGAGAALFQS